MTTNEQLADGSIMKEAVIGASGIILYRNESIKCLEELGFYGIIARPKVLFGTKEFYGKRIDQNKLQIDVKDWFLFIEGVLDLFCNDSSVRASVISNFKMISYELNTSIDNIINKKLEKKKYIELLKRIFSLYSYMDAFSVFNNIAPIRKCQEEVEQILGEEYNFDGIVISLVEPHREFVRRKKIDAAIQFMERGSMQVVEQYRLSARMFEYFDEWLYDDFLLTNSEKLKRELVLLIKQYGRAGLYKEKSAIVENRRRAIRKRLFLLDTVQRFCSENKDVVINKDKLLERLCFWGFVATEEEIRHMVTCKFFLLLGKLARKYKFDISRSSCHEILWTIDKLL